MPYSLTISGKRSFICPVIHTVLDTKAFGYPVALNCVPLYGIGLIGKVTFP